MVSDQKLLSFLNALEKDLAYTSKEVRLYAEKERNLRLIIDGLKELGAMSTFTVPCCQRLIQIDEPKRKETAQ